MSMAKKCDRCKKCYEGTSYRIDISSYFGLEHDYEGYDLCPECKAEFDSFMNGAEPKSLIDRIRYATNRKD